MGRTGNRVASEFYTDLSEENHYESAFWRHSSHPGECEPRVRAIERMRDVDPCDLAAYA